MHTVYNILIRFMDKSLFTLSWPVFPLMLITNNTKGSNFFEFFQYLLLLLSSGILIISFVHLVKDLIQNAVGSQKTGLMKVYHNRGHFYCIPIQLANALAAKEEARETPLQNIDNIINIIEGSSSKGLQMPFGVNMIYPPRRK